VGEHSYSLSSKSRSLAVYIRESRIMSTPVRTLARVVVPWVDSVQTMLSTNRLPKAATERSKVSLSLARQSTSLGPGTALLAVNAM